MRVLIIEDTVSLSNAISEVFTNNNYDVDCAYDGKEGYEDAACGIYDLVVLDLMLPKMDGYKVLRMLRQNGVDVPVLILSAKSELQDKIEGFTEGADDYITKPFEMEELLMRARAILRRRHNPGGDRLFFADIRLDQSKCEITNIRTQKTMQITGKEMQVLERFLCNPNCILGKDQITEKVWGYDSSAEYNNVEVYISFLRKKLKFLQAHAQIRTIRGIGYLLEEIDLGGDIGND